MVEYSYQFKFIIIGDTSISEQDLLSHPHVHILLDVGKSSINSRFTEGTFSTKLENTVGVEFGSRYLDVKGDRIKLQLWDTVQPSFLSFRELSVINSRPDKSNSVPSLARTTGSNNKNFYEAKGKRLMTWPSCSSICAMIVYDITDRISFENVTRWVEETNQYAHDQIIKVLVGNKKDLTAK